MHTYIVREMDYKKMTACPVRDPAGFGRAPDTLKVSNGACMVQKGLPLIICMTFLIGLIFPSIVCLAARAPLEILQLGNILQTSLEVSRRLLTGSTGRIITDSTL